MIEHASEDPIFIVGLYKNGTSWLLAALAAHPEFSALRELDILRSVAYRRWGFRLRPANRRLSGIFGRSEFCLLSSEQLAPGAFRRFSVSPEYASVRSVYDLPPEIAIRAIVCGNQNSDAAYNKLPAKVSAQLDKPLYCTDFPAFVLTQAFTAVRDGDSTSAVMDGFLAPMLGALPPDRQLVLKGADQILYFDELMKYRPNAPKIAIVRDGRDAAVSSFHYRRLMREQHMGWLHSHWSYSTTMARAREVGVRASTRINHLLGYGDDWRLARSIWVWRDRVRRVLKWADRGELYVLRYEDLLEDFQATFAALLAWLGADASESTVAKVAKACSFETVTGRARGEPAAHVIRRGISREWQTALNPKEQQLAWRIAGAELVALGYGKDGTIRASNGLQHMQNYAR